MNEAAPGEAGDGELTEDQSRRLAQIQVIGVIVLIVGGLLAGIFRSGPVGWTSLVVSMLIVLMLGWLAARVQQRPFGADGVTGRSRGLRDSPPTDVAGREPRPV